MKKLMVYVLSFAVILGSLQIGAVQAQAAPAASSKTHYGNGFDSDNVNEMEKSSWENGDMFNCKWEPGNISFNNGIMEMRIDQANGRYTGGEYRTKEYFGYGFYQVSMKPIKNDGVVSSFFTYTGPSDGTTWDEIDIEFLGKDTTHVQFNYYVDGRGGHEMWYDLGFDAAEEYHTYGFNWYEGGITWYVDGEPVYTAPSTDIFPSHPSKIMMNVWPGIGVDDWLKPYDGRTPLYAYYDWIAYDAPESGSGTGSGTGTGTGSGTGTGTGTGSGPESPADLAFGSSWYKIISKNSGKAVDVEYGRSENGTNILQYTYGDTENQQWSIEKQQNGYFTVKNRMTGKVLTVEDFSTALAGNVQQWEYVGNTNQEWSIIPAGDYYKIKNRNSGYLLTVANVSKDDNANVEQYEDANGDAQLWKIECIHARTETRNAKAATCGEDGYTGDEYCAECNARLSSGSAIAKTGNHSWDGGRVTKEATTLEEGEKTYTCTICGAAKTESIPRVGCRHEKVELRDAKEATCGEDGYTGDKYCADCNLLLERGSAIDRTGNHSWDGGRVTKEATALEEGEKTYTCTVCGTTKTESIPKVGCRHEDVELRDAKEATCKEEGYTGDVCCKVCDMVVEKGDKIPKTENHSWDNGKVTTPATAETDGIITFTCTVCNETYETKYKADIPEPGETEECQHTELKRERVKEATCKEEGYTGDVFCAACNKLISEGTTIPKTNNHSWDNGKVTVPATAETDGIITFTCTVCHETNEMTYTADDQNPPEDGEDLETAKAVDALIAQIGEVTLGSEECIAEAEKAYDALTEEQKKLVKNYQTLIDAKNKIKQLQDSANKGDIPQKPEGADGTTGSDNSQEGAGGTTGAGNTQGGVSETPGKQPQMPSVNSIWTDSVTGGNYIVISVNGSTGVVGYAGPLDKDISTVSIPDTVNVGGVSCKVTSIAENAFKNCKKLTKVVVGSNIETIGAGAFMGCTRLKSVTIGKNVKKIGGKAFYGDKKLAKINIKTSKLKSKNVGSKAFAKIYGKATVKVPKKKLKAYKTLLIKKGISRKASIKK